MKVFPVRAFLLAFLLLCCLPIEAAEPPARVLFIGNSFTYYNNGLHNYYKRFVAKAQSRQEQKDLGKKPLVRIMTISGGKLSDHAPALVAMLDRTDWDVVVLQGHSYETIGVNSRRHFRRAVRAFHKEIEKRDMHTALYMTWAYEDRPEMLAPIDKTYTELGASINATVVPVGLAFRKVREQHPQIRLTTRDQKHPTRAGTYLAAAVFFASLHRQSPVHLDYVPPGFSEQQATDLRAVAWEVVRSYDAADR